MRGLHRWWHDCEGVNVCVAEDRVLCGVPRLGPCNLPFSLASQKARTGTATAHHTSCLLPVCIWWQSVGVWRERCVRKEERFQQASKQPEEQFFLASRSISFISPAWPLRAISLPKAQSTFRCCLRQGVCGTLLLSHPLSSLSWPVFRVFPH